MIERHIEGCTHAGWTAGVQFPAEVGNFYPHHRVQTGSGAHPASYPVVTWLFPSGVKRPGHEADHLPSASAVVKNAWGYTSTPPYVSVTCYLVKHGNNFTFYIYRWWKSLWLV